MIEILDNTLFYVTIEEKAVVNSLFSIKEPAAFYYRDGKKVAYHWNLNPLTITKIKRRHKINA